MPIPAFTGLVQDALRNRPDPYQRLNELEDFGESELGGLSRFAANTDAIRDTSIQADREEQAETARERASATSENLRGQLERRQRALGLNLSDRQRRSQNRNLNLTRAISRASAVTGSNRVSSQLARLANRGGTGIREELLNISTRGLTQLANAEGQRRAREAAEEAADDANRNNLIGTAVGTGLALLSSEAVKDKRGPAPGMLDRLRKVRVERWNYKGEDEEHIGAYAEEFNDSFGVGRENRGMISLVDAIGVAMGAIKELDQKVNANA